METADANDRLVIALCGKMRSGKDTAADHLMKLYPNATKLHIAQAVYDTTEFLLGYRLVGKRIDQERKGPFVRRCLQLVGKWGRRLIDKNIWLDRFLKILDTKEGVVFVTGVRFPNEVAALQKAGAYVIRVHCDDCIRIERGATGMLDETETALDGVTNCDFDVKNNNNLNSFLNKLDLCGLIIDSDQRARKAAHDLANPVDSVLAVMKLEARIAARREQFNLI